MKPATNGPHGLLINSGVKPSTYPWEQTTNTATNKTYIHLERRKNRREEETMLIGKLLLRTLFVSPSICNGWDKKKRSHAQCIASSMMPLGNTEKYCTKFALRIVQLLCFPTSYRMVWRACRMHVRVLRTTKSREIMRFWYFSRYVYTYIQYVAEPGRTMESFRQLIPAVQVISIHSNILTYI